MRVVALRMHRVSRPQPGEQALSRFALRLAMSSIAFAAVLLVCPMDVSAEEVPVPTGIGVSITDSKMVKLISPFESEYRTGGDEAPAVGVAPEAHVAEVSVVSNMANWRVAVRFTLPESETPSPGSAAPKCRLESGDGLVVSEQFVENGEILLEGNGRRGHQTLFLKVDSLVDAFGVEVLTESMVEVEGR